MERQETHQKLGRGSGELSVTSFSNSFLNEPFEKCICKTKLFLEVVILRIRLRKIYILKAGS
jgi:hypothetical protein